MRVDNITIGILTAINSLAAQYGVPLCNFVASYGYDDVAQQSMLAFEIAPSVAKEQQSLAALMSAIGIREGNVLRGSDREIFDAISIAAKMRPRSRR